LIKIVLILLLGVGMTAAFAEIEQVNIPFPPPYMLDCSFSTGEFLIFNCIWRSDRIPEDVQHELSSIDNRTGFVPPEEIEASKDKIILKWLSPPDLEIIPEPEPPRPTVKDVLKLKLDPAILAAVDKLGECEYGFEGWAAFQQKSVYEVPDQFIWIHGQIRNDVIVKDLNLKYEACRIQKAYPLSPMYQNFINADNLGLDLYDRLPTHTFGQETNFTKSDLYKPLDAMDFFKAEEKASDYLRDEAPWIDPTLGCVPRDATDTRCQARGNPEPIVKDARGYAEYVNFKAGQIITAQDFINLEVKLKELQCIAHYPTYKHRIGRESGAQLPEWLEHCESIEDEFDRTGIACYKGLDRILCSDLRKMQLDR